MLDSLFSLLVTGLSQYLYTGQVPGRIGNAHPISAPLDSYRTTDGDIIIAVANDGLFRRLAKAIGRPELAADARFATDPERKRNEGELRANIESWSSNLSSAEAVAALEAAEIPASPILSLDQVVASGHVKHRNLVREVDHPTAGKIPIVPQPVQFLGAPGGEPKPPPLLGEHTDEILRDLLGRDRSAIDDLRRSGAV